MSRNLIFGGAIVAVFGLALIAGAFSDKSSNHYDMRVDRSMIGDSRPIGDEVVIESNGRDLIVRSSGADVNCTKNGGSVTITRENGKEITITCD